MSEPHPQTSAESRPPKPQWYRRHWLHLVVVGVAGVAFGVAAGAASSGGPSPELVAARNTVMQLKADIEELQADNDGLQGQIDDFQSRDQEMANQAAKLDDREAALDARAGKLDARAEKISGQEAEVATNTIPGDGLFIVGDDVEAGTYRTEGGSDAFGCYWERLSGTSGEFKDLIINGNSTGPTTVTISPSDEAFSTQGCADWHKQ